MKWRFLIVTLLYVAYFVISLGFVGLVIFVAWHFVKKFW